MGWTSYHIDNTSSAAKKREIDDLYTWSEDSANYGKINVRPLKSSMIGSVYYGAIERTDNTGRTVTAAVVLTRIDNNDYFNFAYKTITEDMGPCYYSCPRSVLDLLTPTTSEYAQTWREKCQANLARPKLADLPNGTRIAFDFCGNRYEARKMPPAYQFKTTWYLLDNGQYMPKSRIKDFEIISTPEARTA